MKRPGMKSRLLLAGCLSVLPIVAVGTLLLHQTASEIAAAQRERLGIRYAAETVALAERIYAQGRLVRAASEGNRNARSSLVEEQIRADQAVTRIESLNQTVGIDAGSSERWTIIFYLYQDFKNRWNGLTADETERLVSVLLKHVFLLGKEVAASSGVASDLDPKQTGAIGFVLEDAPLLLEYMRQAEAGATIAPETLTLAVETAKARFRPMSSTEAFYFGEIERFADAVRRPSEAGVARESADGAVRAVFRLAETAVGSFENGLSRRVRDLTVCRIGIAVAATTALTFELYFFGAFYRSAVRSASALARAERQAYYDPLTDLPNRQRISQIWKQVSEHSADSERMTAVLFLDLDRFKNINDTFGHRAGDALLKATADRMKGCVRDGDHICRIGGDEFLLILPNLAGEPDAGTSAERLLREISRPLAVGDHELVVSASIGISLYPRDGEELDLLIHRADAAMYQAKRRGRNGYCFYRPEMNEEARKRLWTELNLRKGLERSEFVLYYQPRIELAQGTLTGMEALLRWRTNERGLVAPPEFLDVAEETGFIVPLGEWVLRTACRQAEKWRAEHGADIPVSVNISPVQFQREDFVGTVQTILRETAIAPHCLELELRESAMMLNADAATDKLFRLKELGVRIAIDDFGTGFSSLQYLKRFPIDCLKIDRSFIKDVPNGPKDTAITKTIIALGRRLNLRIVAEGVENDDQLSFLQLRKCNEAQGNRICPPLAPESVAHWIRQGQHFRLS